MLHTLKDLISAVQEQFFDYLDNVNNINEINEDLKNICWGII